MTINIGYNAEARKRINSVVKRVEGMPHLPEDIPPRPRGPIAYPLDLYELKTAPELDDNSRMYKATGCLCYIVWCTVDDSGHYYAEAKEGDTGAVQRWRKDTTKDPEDLWFPATAVDSNEETTSAPAVGIGDRVYISAKENRRIVVSGGGGQRAVELKDSLTPGSSAQGWPLSWDDSAHDFSDPDYEDTSNLVTVYDPLEDFRSLGWDDTPEGARGAVVWVNSNNVIVAGDQQAVRISGTASAAVATTDASFTLNSPVVRDNGQSPLTGSNTTITVYNVFGWKIDSGSLVHAELNESNSGHYEAEQARCPSS